MLMKCNANISIPGTMRNANVMQMKCNANRCEKMHNSGSDPLTQLQQDTKGNIMDIFLLFGMVAPIAHTTQ